MRIDTLINFATCLILCIAVYLPAFGGLVSVDESGGLLRVLVAGLMICGTLIACLRIATGERLVQVRPILLGAGLMLFVQLLALTVGAPGMRINNGVLGTYMLQQVAVIGWIIFCYGCDWKSRRLWLCLIGVGYIVLTANAVVWVNQGQPIPFAGLGTRKNTLAAAAVGSVFWSVAAGLLLTEGRDRVAAFGLTVLASFLLVVSGGRASVLFVVCAACSFPLMVWLRTNPVLQWAMFALLIVFHIAIPSLFVNMDRFGVFQSLDEVMQRFTHSLHSGREELWPELIRGIQEHPWTGHGTTASWRFTRQKFGVTQDLSAHNLWLAVLHQSGVVGLTGLVVFLASVWHCLLNRTDTLLLRLSTVFFLGVLIREASEVSLTQNTLQIGIGSWAAIMCGLGWSTAKYNSLVRGMFWLQEQDNDPEAEETVVPESGEEAGHTGNSGR